LGSDTRLTLERSILSLCLLGGSFALLALAMSNANASQFFTPIIAFIGPLCGSTVQWWFRINGTIQEHADVAKIASATASVDAAKVAATNA
jgi:hypothetical protein